MAMTLCELDDTATNYNLLIVCYQQCIKWKRLKVFHFCFPIFSNQSDIMNLANYS